MAEIRCPMCGKPNPDELEVCQFCQARLKPLFIKPQESAEDWLKPAGEETPGERSAVPEPEAPDWLRSLRSHEASIENQEESEAMGDPAEWIRAGLEDPDLLGVNRPPAQSTDWLADFRSGDTHEGMEEKDSLPMEGEPHAPEPGGASGEIDRSIPDWLTSARIETGDEVAESESPEALRATDEAEPEWLTRIRANRPAEPMDQLPEPADDRRDIPDWLKSGDLDLEATAGSLPETPPTHEKAGSWPSYFDRESTEFESETEPARHAEDEEILLPEQELPEWLQESSLSPAESDKNAGPEDSSDHEEPGEVAIEDTPPWYASAPGRPIKPTDQLTEWLRIETTGADAPEESVAKDIPDWLKSSDDELLAPPPTARAEKISAEAGPLLSGDESNSDAFIGSQPDIEPPAAGFPNSENSFLDDEFAALEKELFPASNLERHEESSDTGSGLEIGSDPPWLIELRQKMDESGETMASRVAPFTGDVEQELPAEELAGQELPDWLIDVHAQEAIGQISKAAAPIEEEESGETVRDSGLAQADLPTWLQAMRPVEAVAPSPSELPDERDQNIENAGPLVGIKGALQAEADITALHKSGSFGLKLEVSDMQRARAEMLQELIQKESEAKPVPPRSTISSQRILQIIIAFTLILAILSTLMIDSSIASIPGYPIETGAVSEVINKLGNTDRVLVAVDYQPSFSGEMDAAGSTVLDHLMLRGVQLAFVSSHPSGPLQADRLVGLVNQRYGHNYGADQVSNLGYISGGRAGIFAFATNPRRLAPVTLDTGTNPWEGGALQNIYQASDFSLAVVMTENPDIARTWIEQFQPQLGSKPLIMVLSSQAEPVVRPYYEGSPQQVQGFISGTAGAAAYENLLGRVGIARGHWGAYSLGVLAACVLILVGAIINAYPAVMGRGRKANLKGDEQL